MGTILPKPILSKVISRRGSEEVTAACCCVNGYRFSMEDAHCMEIYKDRIIFGIFDGHNNDKCSNYMSERLPAMLREEKLPISNSCIQENCLKLDNQYIKEVRDGGTTCTTVLIERGKANGKYRGIICNVGDSRTILIRNKQIIFVTSDHKPDDPAEKERIESCGGYVHMNRVDGNLAVSRAFGDGGFKDGELEGDPRKARVIAVPDITRIDLEENDIIVLACDGVFEGAFPTEDVAEFILANMPPSGGDYGVVSAKVCDHAIRMGSKDNISCMIVHLTNGVNHAEKYGESSFVPGPPYMQNHNNSRIAYTQMAECAGSNLPDALQQRYKLFHAYVHNELGKMAPIDQVAFDMCDDVDLDSERNFWGIGPRNSNDIVYFLGLAESETT